MLTLKELRLKNIGRFVTEQVISFDGLGNLVQVDGENRNTGGSSGSGKTTFFNAADYLFGFSDLPVTILQARFTKEGIHVVGTLDWDGKEVILTRGKGKLSISIDGTVTEGSNKLVEEEIDKMLGMDRELFRPIFHKRQKEGGFFLKMGPSDKNKFLTDILGMQKYRHKTDTVDLKIKALEVQLKNSTEAVTSNRAALIAAQDSILALGLAPVRDIHQEVVLKLKATADASAGALHALGLRHAVELQAFEINRPKTFTAQVLDQPALLNEQYDTTKLATIQDEMKAIDAKMEELRGQERTRQGRLAMEIRERRLSIPMLQRAISDGNNAKIEAGKVAEEIKQIRACICPTCLQGWVAEAAKAKEAELLAKIGSLKTVIMEGASSEAALAATQQNILALETEAATPMATEELTALQQQSDKLFVIENEERINHHAHGLRQSTANAELMAQHSKQQSILYLAAETLNREANEGFNAKINAVRTQHSAEMEQARGQANLDNSAFQIGANKLRSYEEARQRYETSFNSLKANEAKFQQAADAAAETLNGIAQQITVAEEAKRAIKSFMSLSFEDALAEIGDGATRIIRSVPNMVNATIQFQGIKETKAGTVKEEVNAVLSMDGEEGIDIRSLSGGEGSAADLAIDLAVIELIENRTNKGINVFILDEPFNGLGTTEIEPTLELLKSLKTNKNIIIVDHNEAVKEMVSDRIVVIREGVNSVITRG